jgi:hypothetical protein
VLGGYAVISFQVHKMRDGEVRVRVFWALSRCSGGSFPSASSATWLFAWWLWLVLVACWVIVACTGRGAWRFALVALGCGLPNCRGWAFCQGFLIQ